MRRIFANETERAVFILANLTDRAKLATLKDDRAVNPRLRQCLHWMRVAEVEGTPPDVLLDAALASYADAPAHRTLVKKAILRNYQRARRLGCLTPDNLELLRHARAPIIVHPRFIGEKLEVDHIIPVKHAPELGNDFANLQFTARSANRRKSARVGAQQVAHAARLHQAGLSLGAATMAALAQLAGELNSRGKLAQPGQPLELATLAPVAVDPMGQAPTGVTLRSNGKNSVTALTAAGGGSSLGSSLASLSGGGRNWSGSGGGVTDPRMIVPRVQGLTEQMEDWERRSGAALDRGEYTQRHVAEHVSRAANRAVAAVHHADEDLAAAEHARREADACRERVANAERRVLAAHQEARGAQTDSDAAHAHWQAQFAVAQGWLARARAAEAHAESVCDHARAALNGAYADLNYAIANLNAARGRTEYAGRDSNGNAVYRPVNTASEEAAVAQAQQNVSYCENQLQIAEYHLTLAQQDRRNAEARVAACHRAVQLTEHARATAAAALEAATRAESSAERALEEQSRAAGLAEQANQRAAEEMCFAQAMRASAAAARTNEGEARAALALAHGHQTDARHRSCQGRLEMTWRMEQLRAFDAPMSTF